MFFIVYGYFIFGKNTDTFPRNYSKRELCFLMRCLRLFLGDYDGMRLSSPLSDETRHPKWHPSSPLETNSLLLRRRCGLPPTHDERGDAEKKRDMRYGFISSCHTKSKLHQLGWVTLIQQDGRINFLGGACAKRKEIIPFCREGGKTAVYRFRRMTGGGESLTSPEKQTISARASPTPVPLFSLPSRPLFVNVESFRHFLPWAFHHA